MSSSELQALFSNLRPRSQERGSVSPSTALTTHPSSRPSSSTVFNAVPIPSTPPPPFHSDFHESSPAMDEHPNPAHTSTGATAQNLLNLLNFGGLQKSADAASDRATAPHSTTAQNGTAPLSASDLVARFMSPPPATSKVELREENESNTQSNSTATRTQLLELLNRQASEALSASAVENHQADQVAEPQSFNVDEPIPSIEEDSSVPVHSTVPADQSDHPARVFGTEASREPTIFEAPKPATPAAQEGKTIFTYTNPFEALNASRPSNVPAQTPATSSAAMSAPFEVETPKMSSSDNISARKKLTPRLRSHRSTTPALQKQSAEGIPAEDHGSATREVLAEISNKQLTTETPRPTPSKELGSEYIQAPKFTALADQPSQDDLNDNQEGSGEWEDADDSPENDASPRHVPVYNFPIKAFVSITLQLGPSPEIGIREDGVMEISRLKKDFDQLDRSLAAATSKYITYAFVKNGGMRIIRQDDGSDRHVFKNSHDRIFNVTLCTDATNAPTSENQSVVGTGVSGAVYYASVCKEGNDLFEKNQLDSERLIFPPYPQADENTAGGVLKTRAKRSSRHPEYFAIGRGKSIQIIWPATALSPRYGINESNRIVDIEKFYADRPLQISTGKAGKDFTFSDDDTLIVSLDKTGRLRFWDITNLVHEANATSARVGPVIVDTPVLSLSTASPAEKSWPTSVTFVDKSRPYRKGGPLRYVLVGLRQNHTLQLWDIALGKAVQELNFPHENETDGICSVNYHPETGIIVVSHPTRNSIFFIHISAPRYSLSSQITQATYVQRVAAKDPEFPKPESTACMSGIRELSFAAKGELRSVELLPIQKAADATKDDSAALFELYVVHSKGVTCLGINRDDLGWNAENKVLYPVDAQQAGLISLKELKLGSIIEEPVPSRSPTKDLPIQTKAAKKKAKKAAQSTDGIVNGVEDVGQTPVANGLTTPAPTETAQAEQPTLEPVVSVMPRETVDAKEIKELKDLKDPKEVKKAKKKADKTSQAQQALTQQPNEVGAPSAVKPMMFARDSPERPAIEIADGRVPEMTQDSITVISEKWMNQELHRFEGVVSEELRKELDSLYQNIREDRAAQDASSASRQEAVLRLVSSSLSTNVEKSLSRILAQQMRQAVAPVVVQHTSAQIADTLASTLHETLPHEVSNQLPNSVATALQNPHVIQAIAASVMQNLSKHLEAQISEMIVKAVVPMFKNVATAAADKAAADAEARFNTQLQQLQLERSAANEKLDKLSNALEGMAGTLQAMSDSQVAFQGQILKDRQALTQTSSGMVSTSRQVSTARGTPDSAILGKAKPMRIRSKADIELEEITNLMNDGRYEEGSIRWLQSAQPVKLFDDLFVRFTPEYLATDVSPLVAFSVAVTVANALNTNTERRLEWISAAFDAVDLQDPEIADLSQHAPALVTSLVQKLESLYMTVAERNPSDPMLRAIPALAKKGRDMKASFTTRATGSLGPVLPQLSSTSF